MEQKSIILLSICIKRCDFFSRNHHFPLSGKPLISAGDDWPLYIAKDEICWLETINDSRGWEGSDNIDFDRSDLESISEQLKWIPDYFYLR